MKRKMMTPREIVASYEGAPEGARGKQIELLALRNSCDPQDIVELLSLSGHPEAVTDFMLYQGEPDDLGCEGPLEEPLMEPREIIFRFESEPPERRGYKITVLADLNACEEGDIVELLQANGHPEADSLLAAWKAYLREQASHGGKRKAPWLYLDEESGAEHTIREWAEELGSSKTAVYRRIESGKLTRTRQRAAAN